MTKKRIFIGAMAAVAIAAGTAGAVAATSGSDKAEQEVLSSAAKKLGVTAEELKSALSAAENEQLDAAVKAGKLTQEQADEIKQHRTVEGGVLGFGHGGPGGPGEHFGRPGFGGPGFGPGGPGFGGPAGGLIDDAATALGISEDKLIEQLRDGKTPAEIAKAAGKSLDDVTAAVKAAATKRLDQAVKDGKLTKEQRDEILKHLTEGIDRLGDGTQSFGPGGPGGGFGHPSFGGPGGFGHPGFGPGPGFGGPVGGLLDDAAKALGITREKLFEQLRAGKTPAEIAKAAGKSLDDVKAAVKAAATKRLDQAVKDGKLTKEQRDEILEHLTEEIERLGDFDHGPPPRRP